MKIRESKRLAEILPHPNLIGFGGGFMSLKQEYKKKIVSANEAVKVVKSGDWVDYSFCLGQPVALDQALALRKEELFDVKIRGGLRMAPLAVVDVDPEREHFCYNSWHFSGLERQLSDKGLCNYIPMIYRNKPLHYRKSLEVDVAMIMVTPMDEYGNFNFSFTNSATKAIVEKAKIVIVEVNENLPRVIGGKENSIHLSEIDFIVEGNHPDIPVINPGEISEEEIKIAALIAAEIPNGATIQLGIGGLPNAVGTMIAESDLKDLGFHTEMLVDAYMVIDKAGKMTNKKKNINMGKGVFSFCAGSSDLYEWVRGNRQIESYPINYVNDPAVMSQIDHFITINNCIEVDLYGQVASESAGKRHISGTGGQLDFVTGGYLSNGGKSFIALTSTFVDKKSGELKSRLVPSLMESTAITNPRSQAHCLVTEWGIADLAGRTTWERAERIIQISHPSFHDELIKQAEKLGIWRKTNKRM